MKILIPILIRCFDKNGETMQKVEIEPLKHEPKPYTKASYAAKETMFGVLYGSI